MRTDFKVEAPYLFCIIRIGSGKASATRARSIPAGLVRCARVAGQDLSGLGGETCSPVFRPSGVGTCCGVRSRGSETPSRAPPRHDRTAVVSWRLLATRPPWAVPRWSRCKQSPFQGVEARPGAIPDSRIGLPAGAARAVHCHAPAAANGYLASCTLGPPAHLVGGRLAEVPHQAGVAQQLDQVVADVNLPPEEALVGAALVVVVVVVPALAESQDRHQQVVAAVVARVVATAAEQMTQRVDREDGMIQQHRADHEAPDETGPAAHAR